MQVKFIKGQHGGKFPLHESITEDRVIGLAMHRMNTLDNPGLCLSCGCEDDGCEPDAEWYKCQACDERHVFGAEQIVICGYYYPDPEPPKEAA